MNENCKMVRGLLTHLMMDDVSGYTTITVVYTVNGEHYLFRYDKKS